MEKNNFISTFFNKNPNFPKSFIKLHFYNDKSKYVLLCNYKEYKTFVKDDIENLLKTTNDSNFVEKYCEIFVDNEDALNVMSNYLIDNNDEKFCKNKFIKFLNNLPQKNNKTTLHKNNLIVAYKLDDNNNMEENPIFKMHFKVQILNKSKKQFRIFIDDAESFDRGKGIYTKILKEMLPQICKKYKIGSIVFNASAYDLDNTSKGHQDQLEKFYLKQGYKKAKEHEKNFINSDDFKDGLPVYYKEIDSSEQTLSI